MTGYSSRVFIAALVIVLWFTNTADGFSYSVAREHLNQWDARAALDEVGDDTSRSALEIRAEAYHLLGYYDSSVLTWEQVPSPARDRKSYEYVKFVASFSKRFSRWESDHFVCFAVKEDAPAVREVLRGLEKAYAIFSPMFDFHEKEKIRVELYPDMGSFNSASSLTKRQLDASGAIGICRFNRLMYLSPGGTLLGYRYVNTAVHEFFHYIIYTKTRANCPIWIHEGSARFFEGFWKTGSVQPYLTDFQINLLLDAAENDKWISFQQMEPSMVELPGPKEVSLAFAIAAITIDYLSDNGKNTDLLKTLYERLGSGGRWQDVLYELKGVTRSDLFEVIKQYIRERGYQRVPGAKLRLKHILDGRQESSGNADDLKLLTEPVVKERIILGDGFIQRNRFRAALAEYRKALRREPGNEVILTRMAIALQRLDRPELAEPYLLRAIEMNNGYPTAYKQLAKLYAARGDVLRMKQYAREAIEIQPYDPEIQKMVYENHSQ